MNLRLLELSDYYSWVNRVDPHFLGRQFQGHTSVSYEVILAEEKILEMSPGHLVKSSLGDVVGQDPLIAFSKVCLCGLERKRISELIFVTHTQGMSESR